MLSVPPRRHFLASLACVAWGFAAATPSTADEAAELHPIAAGVAERLGDAAGGEFVMVVLLEVPEGGADALIAAMDAPTRGTLAEPGNLAYALSRDADNPQRFLLYERWRNVAALDAHLRQPYLVALLKQFADVLAKPPGVTVYAPIAFD
ncbi:MAG: putative quinol monooxygenase [Planctomycetota bacterium]